MLIKPNVNMSMVEIHLEPASIIPKNHCKYICLKTTLNLYKSLRGKKFDCIPQNFCQKSYYSIAFHEVFPLNPWME